MSSSYYFDRTQSQSHPNNFSLFDNGNDDFQIPLTQTTMSPDSTFSRGPLNSCNLTHPHRPHKKPKCSIGKENIPPSPFPSPLFQGDSSFPKPSSYLCGSLSSYKPDEIENCSLDFIPSTIDCGQHEPPAEDLGQDSVSNGDGDYEKELKLKVKADYFRNSIESKLVALRADVFENGHGCGKSSIADGVYESKADTELDLLLSLCSELDEENSSGIKPFHSHESNGLHGDGVGGSVRCPLCGIDISDLTEEQRHVHTNDCLDKGETPAEDDALSGDEMGAPSVPQVVNVSPVVDWLRNLGLAKYEDVFVREEVDWDALQWLTEEDLLNMGITALGPRKKIVHALCELRKGIAPSNGKHVDAPAETRRTRNQKVKLQHDQSERKVYSTSKPAANKLITEYFPGFVTNGKKVSANPGEQPGIKNSSLDSGRKHKAKNMSTNRKSRDVPKWCCIPGTPFRVDAFKYLRGDCSHWFLTHFHLDHYQGLTKSFNHGKIYCSSVTAQLVNMNIGIPYDKLHVLPLNQKVNVAGIDVSCLDANHCPGSIIIIFQPPNGCAPHWGFSLL